ncbi:hypothetical protein SASPL_104757 [Salvia splendens]|uniref:Uncharacterized protein n=1 Tax=Salvia splendens TaxID=180675 RepID=A0A8X8YKH3_SALSN|nr:hypothetical protein SASPL_104757 [Salvia splendens]
MAVFLLKLIFSLVTALSSLLTRLIFNGAAHVVVQMIQAMKVQGESSQRLLDQVKELITKCMEMLMNLIVDAVVSVFSSFFDLVKEGLFSSSSGLAAAGAGLLEKSKNRSFEDALKRCTGGVGRVHRDAWQDSRRFRQQLQSGCGLCWLRMFFRDNSSFLFLQSE